jgi:hydrogenase maturation protein HypF
VFRIARELMLTGLVRNDTLGVTVEIEGPETNVREFQRRLRSELPLPGRIDEIVETVLSPRGDVTFTIEPSVVHGNKETTVLADISPCADCLRELRDPNDRRFRYPFINCTHCGPRFTLITALPYDRPNTTMCGFTQCARCLEEYRDPSNRRFHAQPNACPTCGPHVRLKFSTGRTLAERDVALARSVDALRRGEILAVQGVGGFQLLVDATNADAIRRLRNRKRRDEKPLAVMVASLDEAHRHAELTPPEVAWLSSPEAPIVIVSRRPGNSLAPPIAPGNPRVGLMLPSSPLHHLLLSDLGLPVVATSGNLSEEPIAITEEEAVLRLGTIADLLLVHDRPIARHADDSVVSVVASQPQMWRRARGFAPLPVVLPKRSPVVLGLGGHQKSAVALSVGDRCFLSQHVGDLDKLETRQAYLRVIEDFLRLYEVTPVAIAHDLHPDYVSTQIAEQLTAEGGRFASIPRIAVQHHHAHLAACLAEACVTEPALGVIWDGSGLGTDGTLWGGEFLYGNAENFTRIASFLPMGLPGGDRAARSPRRIALSLLLQHFALDWLIQQNLTCVSETPESEQRLLLAQLNKPALAPRTSSVGRLFDAVASILDVRQESTYEGQAAMGVEFLTAREPDDAYSISLDERTLASQVLTGTAPAPDSGETHRPRYTLDPRDMLSAIVTDRRKGVATERIAARFHAGLVTAVVDVAHKVGVETVALSGGCFQNRRLTEWCRSALARNGHRVILHQETPPNDGGLALGQVAVACSTLSRG